MQRQEKVIGFVLFESFIAYCCIHLSMTFLPRFGLFWPLNIKLEVRQLIVNGTLIIDECVRAIFLLCSLMGAVRCDGARALFYRIRKVCCFRFHGKLGNM